MGIQFVVYGIVLYGSFRVLCGHNGSSRTQSGQGSLSLPRNLHVKEEEKQKRLRKGIVLE
jgi:hypothetical protein